MDLRTASGLITADQLHTERRAGRDATLPRRLVYMPLTVLRPAAKNAKQHDVPGIRRSIRRFGFAGSILCDERTGRMVGGHGTVEALVGMLEDGEPCPEGVVVDDDGGWLVPVERGWESRSDQEATALNLALNRLQENAGYHNRTLAEMLEEVITEAPELLDSTGFEADSIDQLLLLVNVEGMNRDPEEPDDVGLGAGGEASGGAPIGQEEDNPLDAPEDPADDGKVPDNVQCPSCGHRFPLAPGR